MSIANSRDESGTGRNSVLPTIAGCERIAVAFGNAKRPRELEVAHVLRAQAGLRGAQVAMVLLVEAEAGHARLPR